MRTRKEIEFHSCGGHIATIPVGTLVIPADNLPQGGWWVENWSNMTELAQSYARNYGFLLTDCEVN